MYKTLLKIGLPVALENLLANTGTFLVTIILSKFGDTALAINGIAGQAYFLVVLFLFGLNSGAGIFFAQYWGKKDVKNINKIFTLDIVFSFVVSLVFFVFTFFFPKTFLSIYSKDVEVISNGVVYLRIISFTYFLAVLEMCYRTVLRSTEHAIIPMISYIFGIPAQFFFSYAFAFGKFGFSQLGVNGVALGLLIGRAIIPLIQIALSLLLKLPGKVKKFFDKSLVLRFLKYTLPTTGNEIAWSLGITVHSIIFGRMGTQTFAARNVLSSFENYLWTFTFGVVVATSVIVGKYIGQENYESAYKSSKKLFVVNFVVSLVSSIGVTVAFFLMLNRFDVSDESKKLMTQTIWLVFISGILKPFNALGIVGVLRGGGDAHFAFVLETLTMWLVSVPLTYITAFVFKLPLPFVYIATMSDEFVKSIIFVFRFKSKKWIKNVTLQHSEI